MTSGAASQPIHIGFLARDFLKWGGGVWFIQNLLRGLATVSPDQARVTIFVPSDHTPRIVLGRFARRIRQTLVQPRLALQTLTATSPERALWCRGISEMKAVIPRIVVYDGSEVDLIRHCRSEAIDVLMPVMTPLRGASIPWVGYLYDCQHRHYPEFFAPNEIEGRDRAFKTMLQCAPVVFTNAKAVVEDLETFFPEPRSKLFSLPFAPLVREDELYRARNGIADASLRDASGAYYFIVCNQFWIHKDHVTALRAFAQFRSASHRQDFRLVCTGLTSDYRVPGHFERLVALATELKINSKVLFTGYIDRTDQQALLFSAQALIQPTLFEGGPGGGAASDAIALGVPCILSDIAVNRELQHPLATFFKVGDAASLAKAMESIAAAGPKRPSTAELLRSSRERAQQLGVSLLGLARTALAS